MKRTIFSIAVIAGFSAASAAQSRPSDWPQWRGPNRDGVVASFTEPTAWPDQLTRKWKIDVGLGYSTPILIGNRLYMYSRQSDNEVLTAVEAETGTTIGQSSQAEPSPQHPEAAPPEQGP